MNLLDQIKKWGVIVVICLLSLFGLKHCRKVQKNQDAVIVSPILKPTEKEKIIIDPIKHTVTRITDKGTTVTPLPDRPISIVEGKDGKLTILSRTWGKELRPFIGVGVDLEAKPRLHVGADVFYYHKLDLGVGLAFNMGKLSDTRMVASVSYNVYSNTSLGLSVDNHKTPGIFIKVRF